MSDYHIGDPPTDRGPIVGVPKDDLDALRARIRELEAQLRRPPASADWMDGPGTGAAPVTVAAQERFADWFRQNYPGPDTIIYKPDWHAPKIFRAALRALAGKAEPTRSEVRYQDNTLDEVIAKNVDLHVEQLDDGVWWLGITHPDGTVDHVRFYTARGAKIMAQFEENC